MCSFLHGILLPSHPLCWKDVWSLYGCVSPLPKSPFWLKCVWLLMVCEQQHAVFILCSCAGAKFNTSRHMCVCVCVLAKNSTVVHQINPHYLTELSTCIWKQLLQYTWARFQILYCVEEKCDTSHYCVEHNRAQCARVCVFVRGLCPKNTEISAFWKLHPLLYEHKVFHTSLFVLSHTSALKYIIWDAAPSLSVWFTGVILVRMTAWLLRRYDMLSKRLQGVVSFPKDEQRTSASQRHPESKRLHSHTLQAHHPLLL